MLRPRLLAAVPLFVCVCACAEEPPLDTTRQAPERGTLGEEVFRLVHRDLERESPRRAEGFMLARDGFVAGVDHLFPDAELADVQDLLVGLLPYYDDETIPELTRRMAAMTDRMDKNADAMTSYAALSNREGYVDTGHTHALALRLARYPRFLELAKRLIDVALDHDGLDTEGEDDPEEDDTIRRLLAVAAEKMRDAEITEDDERDIVIIADLLLSEDQRLATAAAPAPHHAAIVDRDTRGMAQVILRNGAVPAPFADAAPADGEPDVDTSGRFIDLSGRPIVLPPFGASGVAARDSRGRPLAVAENDLIYDYVELDRSVLAGLLRDTRDLIEDGVPMKIVRSLEALLGARKDDGTYEADNNRLLDLVHAAMVTLDGAETPELLEVARRLIEQHPGELTYLLVEVDRQMDIAGTYDVALRRESTFFDEIMGVIRKILREPGLAEELLDAVERDDALQKFPQASATLSEYKKLPIAEADLASRVLYTVQVDRTKPDTRDNSSHHQRLLHLIYDTHGARYEPRFVGVPLGFIFEIDDLAEFYLLSVIGESQVPSLVSRLTGLSERPTPQELARFINSDQTFGNPVGNEGIEVKDNDGDTLFAATSSEMTDALAPLIRIFHRRGKLSLLFEAFETLHLHYGTEAGGYQTTDRRAPRYSKLSGIYHYEPLLIDVHRNARVLRSVRNLLAATRDMRTAEGRPARDVLLTFARRFFAKDGDLETRDGKKEVLVDGERVAPLSPFDLIRGAQSGLHSVLDRRATTEQEWKDMVSALHATFMKTEAAGQDAGRFTNSRTPPILAAALGVFESRARAHAGRGKLSEWLRTDLPKSISDAIESEGLPALLDLIHLIEDDPELLEMATELREELLAEENGFGDLTAVAGEQLASAKDARFGVPWVRFLGREIEPSGKMLFEVLSSTKEMLQVDVDLRLIETVRRGLEKAPDGSLYIDGITRAIRQANRTNPLDEGPITGADVDSMVGVVDSYLRDERHGLEKFYEVIEERR